MFHHLTKTRYVLCKAHFVFLFWNIPSKLEFFVNYWLSLGKDYPGCPQYLCPPAAKITSHTCFAVNEIKPLLGQKGQIEPIIMFPCRYTD